MNVTLMYIQKPSELFNLFGILAEQKYTLFDVKYVFNSNTIENIQYIF